MSKTFKIVGDDISDGFHTFAELYDHRVHLYLALAAVSGWPAYYRCDYDEWFCLYLETPHGQLSYHLPNTFLDRVKLFAQPAPDAYKWDGHNSQDVLLRLEAVMLEYPEKPAQPREDGSDG